MSSVKTILILRASSVTWALDNPILRSGQQGYETDTGVYKIGNGFQRWNELDSYIPKAAVLAAIQEAVANLPGGGDSPEALNVHINSATPHPIYDDGPSLVLLYENAKV